MNLRQRVLSSVAEHKVGWDGIVGARLRPVLALVPIGDEVGQALLNRFLTLSERALQPGADPWVHEACAHAARALYDWAGTRLHGAARQALQQEVLLRWKPVYYTGEALQVPLPRLPEIVEATAPEVQRVEGLLRRELSSLLDDGAAAGAEAMVALQRMQAVIGPGPQGWGQLAAYCHRNLERLAESGRALREVLDHAARLPAGSAARRDLERRATRELSGMRWQVRGLLGEMYLRHWPSWQRMLSELMADANQVARHGMGEGWQVEHFAGEVMVDGLQAWDEVVLLVNRAGRQAALHTAAQVKVEKVVSAFKQMLKDRARETGKLPTPSTIQLWRGGRWETFAQHPLPAGTDAFRYVFHAGGGRVRESHLRMLERAQMSAQAFELDLALGAFDALALEVMYAVERLARQL